MLPLRRSWFVVPPLVFGIAILASLLGSPTSPVAVRSPDGVAAGPDSNAVFNTVFVRQRNKSYDPPVVVIHEGDTVVWVMETNGGWHDVQSYEGLFGSSRMEFGDVFSKTFDQSGTFGYFCTPHVADGMNGTVVVLPPDAPLPEPLPVPPDPVSTLENADPVPPGTPDTIMTVAGGGGNGGPAVDASLYLPEGVALDDRGRLFVSDTENCQVRRVDESGTIVSVIGHESCGYSMGSDADMGPWLHTNHPRGVAAGPDGALYVADIVNCRVRRVADDGSVSTYAGVGSCRASGDGGPAVSAGIAPWGLAWDPYGNLFVADVFNCQVRRVDQAGNISRVAGNGTCGFSGDGGLATQASLFFPRDVAVGPDEQLYIADSANCRVRRMDLPSGLIDTVAGTGSCAYSGDGGPATAAGLHPWALDTGPDGRVLVADRQNCRIRQFEPDGEIDTVAGSGDCGLSGDGASAAEASLNWPSAIAVAGDGVVYVVDTGNCRVRRIGGHGIIDTVVGSGVCRPGGDGGPAVAGGGWHPIGLAMAEGGEWYFSELDTCRIRRIGADGVIETVAGTGICGFSPDGGLATESRLSDYLGGIALADDGSLFISEGFNCRVRRINVDGAIDTVAGTGHCGFSGDGGPARDAQLSLVSDVALDGNGGLLIAGPFNCRVRRVDLATGLIETVVGDGSCSYNGEDIVAEDAGVEPWGIAVGPDGALYMADMGNCRVRRVDGDGRVSTLAGGDTCGYDGDGGPATDAQLMNPNDVVVDAEGNVYAVDLRTFTVRKVDTQGIITTVAGTGMFRPIDVGGYDPTNGFFCTLHNLPVPAPTYMGDGGPGNEAGLYAPYGIALGYDQHLYITDTFDHRVRRVTCGGDVPCAGPVTFGQSPATETPTEVAPTETPATETPTEVAPTETLANATATKTPVAPVATAPTATVAAGADSDEQPPKGIRAPNTGQPGKAQGTGRLFTLLALAAGPVMLVVTLLFRAVVLRRRKRTTGPT